MAQLLMEGMEDMEGMVLMEVLGDMVNMVKYLVVTLTFGMILAM